LYTPSQLCNKTTATNRTSGVCDWKERKALSSRNSRWLVKRCGRDLRRSRLFDLPSAAAAAAASRSFTSRLRSQLRLHCQPASQTVTILCSFFRLITAPWAVEMRDAKMLELYRTINSLTFNARIISALHIARQKCCMVYAVIVTARMLSLTNFLRRTRPVTPGREGD